MMRSFKKNNKRDLGNGSYSVTGANADGIHHTNTDGVAYTNPDGATHTNTDDAEQPEESNDSSGTFNWDDFEPDAGTIKLDLNKIHGIPGSSKQSVPESTAEMLRKYQWVSGWRLPTEDISFEHGLAHLKHTVKAMESGELKAHLKTTGILFKGVKSEISRINDKVGGIKDHVDSSLGRMITKSQVATIISSQQDLHKSQQLLQSKMEAMKNKFDLLLSFLLADDSKKGEKALVTKCGPELKTFKDDREGGGAGGSGKDKAVVTESTAAVQLAGTAAGSSKEAGGSSSGQGQRQHQILMDPTLMLDPDTISKKFTQEIEIGGKTERVFYRDPRLQQADEELAKKLNQELNPDYNLEESIKELRRLEKKKIQRVPRGKGKRDRGRTQTVPAKPIEKGITIREPVEQSKSSLTKHPSGSSERKGKGILIEEPKKSKKDSCLTQFHESMQSTPTEQEEKKCDEVVESVNNAIPEESTLQSTANPEGSNPDGTTNPDEDSTANPDGGTIANPDGSIPDEQRNANTEEQEVNVAHDSEELNPEQEDEEKKASKLKKYVYLNEMISREKMREAMNEALRRYIYNIKKFKDRWRKPIPADKDVDRRRHFPPRPRSDSKFTPDYQKLVKFIPESGVVQGQQEQRRYRYSWAEMADKGLDVQEDFKTFGLGHPEFQKNSRLPQLKDTTPLIRRIDETLSQEHLDRLMCVSLIIDQMDGNTDKEKMLYFLEDGLNYKLNEIELMQKNWKELEHVLFLFKEKNSVCSRWKRRMEATAAFQKRCIQVNEEFKPKYLNAHGEEVEMKKGDAKLETFLGKTMLSFNPESIKGCSIDIGSGMHRSKIRDLRAAIYQLEADIDELVKIKEDMVKHLESAEEKLMIEFLDMNPMFRRVQEADNLQEEEGRW